MSEIKKVRINIANKPPIVIDLDTIEEIQPVDCLKFEDDTIIHIMPETEVELGTIIKRNGKSYEIISKEPFGSSSYWGYVYKTMEIS